MANPKTKAQIEADNAELQSQLDKKDKEFDLLKEQMVQMQQMMQQMMSQPKVLEPTKTISNRKIPVYSMIPHLLNLTTEDYGQGKPYTFPHFGYKQNIKLDDLENIVHLYRSQAESGMFFIDDKEAVIELGLEDEYKSILGKDTMERLVSMNDWECVGIFEKLSKDMQENVFEMIAKNINKGQSYDFNIIKELEEICDKKIDKLAAELKHVDKLLKGEVD